MASEINQVRNRLWDRWRATAIEWLAVIIATSALLVAFASVLVCSITIAVLVSTRAEVAELNESMNVYRIRAAKLNAYLAARGVNLEEIYHDE